MRAFLKNDLMINEKMILLEGTEIDVDVNASPHWDNTRITIPQTSAMFSGCELIIPKSQILIDVANELGIPVTKLELINSVQEINEVNKNIKSLNLKEPPIES
jgi:hypothetical protein